MDSLVRALYFLFLFARRMNIDTQLGGEQVQWDLLSRSPSLSLLTNGRKMTILTEQLVPVRQVSSLAFVVRPWNPLVPSQDLIYQ